MAAPDTASPQPGSADGGEQTWPVLLPRQAGEAVRGGDALWSLMSGPAVERIGGG